MIWRWFDQAYECLARGEVDLGKGGTAALSTQVQADGKAAETLRSPAPIKLVDARVVRVGADTGWVFSDLQWGPEVSAEGVRSIVVSCAGKPMAYLPLDKSYDVVNGVFSVVVDPAAVLLLGNRR